MHRWFCLELVFDAKLRPAWLPCSLEDDVVPMIEKLYGLEHLSLGFNELDGELTCGLLGPEKKLHELDLAHNRVEGSIPQCLLGSQALQELYLANNELTGSLPGVTEGSRLTVLSLFDQASTTAQRAVFCVASLSLALMLLPCIDFSETSLCGIDLPSWMRSSKNYQPNAAFHSVPWVC